jgi:hypothetical protein
LTANQQTSKLAVMKTTIDLPADLVRQVKLEALREGRKLKDTMAELLRRGLSAKKSRVAARSSRVKLPLVHCRRSADLTPRRVAEVLSEQEAQWHHEAS